MGHFLGNFFQNTFLELSIKIPGRKAKSRLGITLCEETQNKENNKAGLGLAGLGPVDLGGVGGHHADHVPGEGLPYAPTRLTQSAATFQQGALTLARLCKG